MIPPSLLPQHHAGLVSTTEGSAADAGTNENQQTRITIPGNQSGSGDVLPVQRHPAELRESAFVRSNQAAADSSGPVIITIAPEQAGVPQQAPQRRHAVRATDACDRSRWFPSNAELNAFARSAMWARTLFSRSDSSSADRRRPGGDAPSGQASANYPMMQEADCEAAETATVATGSSQSFRDFYSEEGDLQPMRRAEVNEMVIHGAIANSAYYDFEMELLKAERLVKRDATIAQTTWKRFELPDDVQHALALERFEDGRLYHRESCLVALVLRTDETKQVVIGFGGTTAGRNKGALIYRLVKNPLSSLQQWKRNLQSIGIPFMGKAVPDSYLKAAEIANSVNQLVRDGPAGEYEEYSFSVTGHSKGAAEAEFAALMHPTIRAVCFSTPPLGRKVLKTIPSKNFELAKENIQHYFVRFDLIPSIHTTLKKILNTSHIGTARWLPAPKHVVTGFLYPLWAHDLFNDCVADYAYKNTPSPSEEVEEARLTIQDLTSVGAGAITSGDNGHQEQWDGRLQP